MRRTLAVLPVALASVVAVCAPGRAAPPSVTLGKVVRITTPGDTKCPAEGESYVLTTAAGTWVGYNDDHDCLYPVLGKLARLTGLQLLPAHGGPAKFVQLPLIGGGYYSGDPALAPDPSGAGVLLATLYGSNAGVTVELFRVTPSLAVSHLPSPALHADPQHTGATTNNDDKEFFAVDANPRSRYRGRVYLAWDDFTTSKLTLRAFVHNAWRDPVLLGDPGKADVAVAQNGDVAVAYEVPDGVAVRVSHDGGAHFGDAEVAVHGGDPGRIDPSCPLRPTVGTRQRATKAVRATYDALGRLHVVAAIGPQATLPAAGVAYGGSSTIVHAVSADRGATWHEAALGASTAERFEPAIARTPSGGVAVAWLEVSDATFTKYDAFLAVAARGSSSFSAPVRLSTASALFPSAMEAMDNSNCYGIGDYIGLSTTPRGVVAAWPTTDDKTTPQVDSDVLVREAILR